LIYYDEWNKRENLTEKKVFYIRTRTTLKRATCRIVYCASYFRLLNINIFEELNDIPCM